MKEIIILAMGESRYECPYDAEVWALNNGYKQIAQAKGKLNKLFLAHSQVHDTFGNPYFDWGEINRLQQNGVEIINTHRVKGLNSKLYPLKRISQKLECDYFSDTIAYMLAYAIDQHTIKNGHVILKEPLRIRMYGADMHTDDEYATEKGGIEYWIGYARALGIKVDISKGSALLKTITGKPYGVKAAKQDVILQQRIKGFLSTEGKGKVKTGIIPDFVINGALNKEEQNA